MSTVAIDVRPQLRPAETEALPRPAAPARVRPLGILSILLQATAIVLLLLLNKGDVIGLGLFFTVLAAMFVISPEMAMRALVLGYLGLVTNTYFVPKHPAWTLARFALMSAAFARFSFDLVQMRQTLLSRPFYIALLFFIAASAIASAAGGYFVRISILKLISFAVGTSAVFAGVLVLHRRKSDLTEWFVAMILAICVFGLASLPLGVAYNAKRVFVGGQSQLFNGPFYHPNTAGPFCAVLTVYLVCVFLLTHYRNRWLVLPLAGCLVWFLSMSQSRTGAGVLLIGLTVLGVLYFFQKGRGRVRARKRLSRFALVSYMAAGIAGLAILDVLTGGQVARSAINFVNKRAVARADVELEEVFASRQFLIANSWKMFKESPLIGHGFEVDKSEAFQKNAGLFSAPLEKGFLPTAVLEEVGILGTIPFVIFVVLLGVALYRSVNIPGLVMWCTFLAVNLGEVMIFSPGGHGGMGWLLVGAGILLGDQCVTLASTPVPKPRPEQA